MSTRPQRPTPQRGPQRPDGPVRPAGVRPLPRPINNPAGSTPDPANQDTTTATEDGGPVSVWASAQAAPARQRRDRYLPASTAHPAKMLPAIAAHAIAHYTRPGELVLDPMCGIGTTLVEALHLGRAAIGVEYEPEWAAVARANLDHTHAIITGLAGAVGDAGAAGPRMGRVWQGDARQLATILPARYRGRVALVVTSPPYGPSTHGQVIATPGHGVRKYHYRYGSPRDRDNLANLDHQRLLSGFTTILTAATGYLRPGGHVVITVRPWREHTELIDLPTHIWACGETAGLVPVERCVALLARIDNDRVIARGSFFQRDFIRKQRDAGIPLNLIAHEDVLVFQKPPNSESVGAAAVLAGPVRSAIEHLRAA